MLAFIADDDPVVQHILGAILSSLNFTVESATCGADCLSKIPALLSEGKTPAVLFLDMMLGDIAGTEVLKELRIKQKIQFPVIMLSANPAAEMATLSGDSKPDHYLEKPFTSASVTDALNTLGVL